MPDDPNESKSPSPDREKPEPPRSYRPDQPMVQSGQAGGEAASYDLSSTKRIVVAAQVMALISLVIGGVFLSSVALAFAIVGRLRVNDALLSIAEADATWAFLKRSSTIALAASAVSLVLNAVTLVIVYPIVMEAVQSGEFSSLFPSLSGETPAQPSAGASTWG